jgi:chromate reductase, NAD(P)H dehydrogenase (quinone)
MREKKNIFAIIGSASTNSSNEQLVNCFAEMTNSCFNITIFTGLKSLPHFDPELSAENPPAAIADFRKLIADADGLIICTPEYVFGLPSGLKNAIEWCVATTVFSGKPTGLITASADGHKGHEELQLIMKTVMANFTRGTTLLVNGIKGKIDAHGQLKDEQTKEELASFIDAFSKLLKGSA